MSAIITPKKKPKPAWLAWLDRVLLWLFAAAVLALGVAVVVIVLQIGLGLLLWANQAVWGQLQ